jgi:hypothetical protein
MMPNQTTSFLPIMTDTAAQAACELISVTAVCTTIGSSFRQAVLVLQGYKYGCLPVI